MTGKNTQDPARVARYAEAIRRAGMGLPGPEVPDRIARAVMAVADEEHAALVAEVERLDQALDAAIGERDAAQDWADRLAYAIAGVEVIGEHSSTNDPWVTAVEVAGEERVALVERGRASRNAFRTELRLAQALTRISMLRQERDAARAENAKQSKIRSRLTTLDATNLKSEIRRADAAEELVREMGREAVTEAEAYRAVLARAEAAEAEVERLQAKVAKVEALAFAVRALRSRVHASKERGAAYDAWVLTDLLDSALEGHTCTDPNAECWACAALAEGTPASPTSQTTGGGCSDAPAEQRAEGGE